MNIPKDHPVQPLKPGEEAIDKVKCDLCGELVSQSEADEADEIAERMLGEEWARNNNTCRECADGLSPDDPVGNLPKTDKS